MYKWQQVRVLQARGESIKQIAKKVELSRNTVRKYLRSVEAPRFKARRYERRLDPYEDEIREMLGKRYIGTRIYRELLQRGYQGSLSSVHRYLAALKEGEEIQTKATTRVETAPGEQMQYDWKEWYVPVRGHRIKVYLHEVVLSYSRKKHYSSSLSITTQDVIRAIAGAIEFFGGSAEELLIDNPKQMVVTHRRNGIVRYTDAFSQFCGLYGIQPTACRIYRARTKGKAERPFYYLQEHLLRGLEVEDLATFDRLLAAFTETYNARPHSELKESPDERFVREKDALRTIPVVDPAMLYDKPLRRISAEGYLSWEGAFYPVPMRYCLHEVRVESEFGKRIKVYALSGELIAEHPVRIGDKGIRPIHPEHEAMNESFRKKREAARSGRVAQFLDTFPHIGARYVEGLRTAVTANLYWHIDEIMNYARVYATEDVAAALSACIEIGAYHKNSVMRLLERAEPNRTPPVILNHPCSVPPVDIRRPLAEYGVEVVL